MTPILDRLAPLPAPVPPRSGMTVVVVVWTCVLAALVASVILGRPPVLREWLLHDASNWIETRGLGRAMIVVFGWWVLVTFAMVAVHEGGHVLGGLAAGFRFKAVRVGPLQFDRPFRVSFQPGLHTAVNGVATVVARTTDRLVPRAMVMVAAGPAANILSGCLVLLLPWPPGFAAALFMIQSIANGSSDLLPYRSKLGVSDGRFLWALWRQPPRAERWLAHMRLGADISDGVMPESLPAGFLGKALAFRDDSIDTVVAHAFAFSNAFHQHKDAAAGQMLETCLRYASHAPATMRDALMSDAAVFQARRCRRVDLAEQWLADIPLTTPIPWIRPRVEAAILEAQGDIPGALAKLDEFERAVSALPNPLQRDTLLRLLRRWQSELRAA